MLRIGSLVLEPASHRVTRNGAEIRLVPGEFALLGLFLRHPNQVFSADALLDRVWRSDANTSTDTVRQSITRLRQKLGAGNDSETITTIHGVGYRLDAQQTRSDIRKTPAERA